MNNIRGNGFRPYDEELIRYLEDVAFDRDSPVQYITLLEDICQYEPWELPGLSALRHPGCKVWYFIYSLNYKYRRGKQIKRATKEGYWKSTGKPRKVKASDTKAEIGSKRTLVFHGGRPEGKKSNTKSDNDKKKEGKSKTKHGSHSRNKAVWVIHEFQLNTATPPNQKTFLLGKLMKQSEEAAGISNNTGASSQDSPSNLRNQVAKSATTSEDQSDSNKPFTDVEESGTCTNEQDNYTQTDENEIFNQHNRVAENDSSNWPASSENDSIDLSDCDLCDVEELLKIIQTPDD